MIIVALFKCQVYLALGHTNSPLSNGGHIVPGDQKKFVLPR